MRYIKLTIISIVAFYLLIWGMSAVLPGANVLSRVVNIAGHKDSIAQKMKQEDISYRSWLTNDNKFIEVITADTSFYTNDLFNSERQANVDTIYFEIRYAEKPFLKGGIGLYQLEKDSTTVQLFYVFKASWYKPWDKMSQMMNDTKYGYQMEAALQKLKKQVEQ